MFNQDRMMKAQNKTIFDQDIMMTADRIKQYLIRT